MSAASPTHQDRLRTPNSANGASDGLSNTKGAVRRDDTTTARASAAIDQITGLPVQIFSSVVGLDRHSAMSGQTTGRGRSRTTAAAVTPRGIDHQAMAARAVHGA